MNKRIAKLVRDPFHIKLTDRPISMYVDRDTGDIFIDEGAGNGRMNGAAIPAFKGPKFTCSPSNSGWLIKLECTTFVWEAGWTDDAADAASWVEAVNRFLATKKDMAATNGRLAPQVSADGTVGDAIRARTGKTGEING
jgi:hypothetical protein